jgi:hypothetical protein
MIAKVTRSLHDSSCAARIEEPLSLFRRSTNWQANRGASDEFLPFVGRPIRGRTRPARYAGFAKADRRGSNHLDMEQGTSTKWIETQAKITELREENDALRIAYPAFLSNVHNFPALTNVGKEMPPRQNYPLRAALSDLASFAVGHTCSCQEAR